MSSNKKMLMINNIFFLILITCEAIALVDGYFQRNVQFWLGILIIGSIGFYMNLDAFSEDE